MSDLILYLGITFVGYIIGSKVRDKKDRLSWTGKVQTVAITCLVMLMGMRMGSNEEITANLSTIGLSALVITVIVMAFSIIAIFGDFRQFSQKRRCHFVTIQRTI